MVSAFPSQPLLEMDGISKAFPGVQALSNVPLKLHAGEVLALLGENGAGKSTLIKILGGVQHPDDGTIKVRGNNVRLSSPVDSRRAGIGIIYQEFNLIPELSAWENIFLGNEPSLGFKRRRAEQQQAQSLFQRMNVEIPLDIPCGQLSVAQQQIVEIAKALSQDASILLMDEPTAALNQKEVEGLYTIIRELQQSGIGIIYVSHRLEEIFELADRVTVLRDGQHVGERPIDELDRQTMIQMMVGREIEDEFPKIYREPGAVLLSVKNFSCHKLIHDVNLDVRKGEVLGITGLMGAGRTELARLIFGADNKRTGLLMLDGKPLSINNPRDAINAGICLLTEDRKHQGLILEQSVQDNFALPNLDNFSRFGFVNRKSIAEAFDQHMKSINIKVSGQKQTAKNLSGGNQQKVVLAKWLHRNSRVIIFDEPTRGIDVGAKQEIYKLINSLTEQGKAIIMISSELPEILGMSDRIIVMHEGRVTGEVSDPRSATQEQLMELAVS